jgi:2-haloacid dehalogenase
VRRNSQSEITVNTSVVIFDAYGTLFDVASVSAACTGITHKIVFVSSNGWDACGAVAFGLRVAWINRNDAATERLGVAPHKILKNLTELSSPDLLA